MRSKYFFTVHYIVLFLVTLSSPLSGRCFLYFSDQILGLGGSPATSPREGITDAMAIYQKGTLSLGEASQDPHFQYGLQEN